MESEIAQALFLSFPPLAFFSAQEPPPEATEIKPLCSMLVIAQAAKGKTMVVNQATCSCHGAAAGFGLEPFNSAIYPGGHEWHDCLFRFLCTGNKEWRYGCNIIKALVEDCVPKITGEKLVEGEGFFKNPALEAQWIEELPRVEPAGPYVVIKPLEGFKSGEKPKVVSFLVDPDQLSALVALANFARPGVDNVRIPFSTGCASLALYPFYEAVQANPRAVIGLTDISARFYLGKILGREILSFTIPWNLFEEMEWNVSESFLTRFAWKSMMNR